jgi:hypothetical protein
MITSGGTLIIDDRQEDGFLIGKALWDSNISCMFFHYDEEKLREIKEKNVKYTGIRVIFLDIQLMAGVGGIPSKTNFDAACMAIDALLSDKNGPWLMITWSTWNTQEVTEGEPSLPVQLFDHLKRNLEESKQPFHQLILDKEKYTSGLHEPVKNDISQEEVQGLREEVKRILPVTPYLDAFWQWEYAIKNAASNVVSNIASLTHSDSYKKLENLISWILKELSVAESGLTEDPGKLVQGLERILHNLLFDDLNFSRSLPKSLFENEIEEVVINKKIICEWRRRINRVLHFDFSSDIQDSSGCFYEFEEKLVMPRLVAFRNKYNEVFSREKLIDLFVSKINMVKGFDPDIPKNLILEFIDISPPCDIANGKAILSAYL